MGFVISHQARKARASQPAADLAFTLPPADAQSYLPAEPILACADFPANGYRAKPACRREYAPSLVLVCPIRGSSVRQVTEAMPSAAPGSRRPALIGDFAAADGGHLTAFLRAGHRDR